MIFGALQNIVGGDPQSVALRRQIQVLVLHPIINRNRLFLFHCFDAHHFAGHHVHVARVHVAKTPVLCVAEEFLVAGKVGIGDARFHVLRQQFHRLVILVCAHERKGGQEGQTTVVRVGAHHVASSIGGFDRKGFAAFFRGVFVEGEEFARAEERIGDEDAAVIVNELGETDGANVGFHGIGDGIEMDVPRGD